MISLVRLFPAFVLWVCISILRLTRVVRIEGWDSKKFFPGPDGLIVIHRHPSYFMEVWYLPALLFPQYVFCPSKMPLVVADAKNFGKKRYLAFRPMMILLDRTDATSGLTVTREILNHLGKGRAVFLAPGGGRERTGKNYKIKRENGMIEVIPRPIGNFDLRQPILRRFTPGIVSLLKGGAAVLDIWVEPRSFLGSARVVMGEPHRLDSSLSKKDRLESLENDMLRLAGT